MSQYGKLPLGYRNPGDDCSCQSDRDFGCRPDPFSTCQPASCGCPGGIPGPRGPRGATGPTGHTGAVY